MPALEGQELSGTEQAIFGRIRVDAIADLLSRYLTRYLGIAISEVLFRAGRIDAVWAVRTNDGREMVVKAHRQPVDLAARKSAVMAQRLLADAHFPCPEPITGPDQFDNLVLSAETLLAGGRLGSGRHPGTRRSIAGGLAEHIDLLRNRPGLRSLVGPGPAWCQYHGGPWPIPHDPIFDFHTSPDGFEWLDNFAQEAADRLISAENQGEIVVGHADWYCGNLRFDDDRLVAAFDWDLVADTEPVIAGLSAGSYTASGTSGTNLPSPDDVAAFLVDYDSLRSQPFGRQQQRVAAAAASWAIAYNARCELSMLVGEPASGSTLEMARQQQAQYLKILW